MPALYRLKKDLPLWKAGTVFKQRTDFLAFFLPIELKEYPYKDFTYFGDYFPAKTRDEWLEPLPDEEDIKKAKELLEQAGYEVRKAS